VAVVVAVVLILVVAAIDATPWAAPGTDSALQADVVIDEITSSFANPAAEGI